MKTRVHHVPRVGNAEKRSMREITVVAMPWEQAEKSSAQIVVEMHQDGMTESAISKQMRMSRGSVEEIIRRHEANND